MAGGVIGTELARELLNYTNEIRLVSRNPQKVNTSDQLFKADLLNMEQTAEAVNMYDGTDLSDINENMPIKPPSRKGKVRAHIANMLMDEIEKGNIQAVIVRAADFYGNGANSS